MTARGQGRGPRVVAGVTPSMASARTRRQSAGTARSIAENRLPPTSWTEMPSGTSRPTPGRSTTCSSSSVSSSAQPLNRFSATTPRLVPATGTALTTTRTAATVARTFPGAGTLCTP